MRSCERHNCSDAEISRGWVGRYSEKLANDVIGFHPRMLGLTGPWENVKAACKVYRVYFSTPPNISPKEDYVGIARSLMLA